MRKKSSLYNILGSMLAYFTAMLFNFITQATVIKVLGVEYSGVNGLFTNILTMLSIAELGIGTTIIYKLYDPISKKDKEKIKSWMHFYKICYRYVAVFVTLVGVSLIPLIPMIVGKVSISDNILILYIISLFDTVVSYVMTYKRSILYADQKNYIINVVHTGYTVFMNLTQIMILYITKNYFAFLVVKLIYRIFENIIINLYINKHYLYINEKCIDINKEEKKDVINRIKAIFLQKVSFVVNKGIDNITISMFLGVTAVGYYTNYNLIATAIAGIIFQIVSGMTASVGDLLTENNSDKSYSVYKKINMFNSVLTCLGIVGFVCCIEPFVKVWIGKEYLMSNIVVLSFALYIYSDSIRRSITIYKEAAGICKEDQYMYIWMTFINLIFSIFLCKLIGVSGVILGTALSYLFLIFYSYPKYIFKNLFKVNVLEYYKLTFKYILYIVCSSIISYFICQFILIDNALLQLILNIIVSVSITIIIFIILFCKTSEFKYYFNLIINIIKKLAEK